MRDLHLNDNNRTNVNRFGCFPLTSSKKISQSSKTTKSSIESQDNKEFIREALQVHNELRQKHNVEPLRLNNDLSNLAQEWGK